MPWQWPWARETRESGGDFSDAVVRLIEAQAAGSAGGRKLYGSGGGGVRRSVSGFRFCKGGWAFMGARCGNAGIYGSSGA